ncbi:MAG: hypothetical protein B6245_05895 [Desulfobacteraceae bacterium 4572_88]|nr:MAG: hypothetical protein B6245_05895 [Desulfobacteraceae bacterium 4572_88]
MTANNDQDDIVIIPHNKLKPETLQALIEDFVGREGSDYGKVKFSFEEKMQQVRRKLRSGRAMITFDQKSQTCNIVSENDPRVKAALNPGK